MTKGKAYFPGLNGLRAVCALMMVVVHASLALIFGGHDASWVFGWHVHPDTGKLIVILFFTLSGFLITFLLLGERERDGDIDVGRFYLRRILRIWPLYYALVFLGFFVLPGIEALALPGDNSQLETAFTRNLMLYLFLLPNVAAPLPFIGHLWSIGVEEQFYILWPLLNRLIRNTLAVLLGVIAVYVAILLLLYAWNVALGNHRLYFSFRGEAGLAAGLFNVWFFLRIDCMAIGGLGAWLLKTHPRLVARRLYPLPVQLAALALMLLLYVTSAELFLFYYEAFALVFVVLILNVATNPDSLVKLRQPVMDYLGRISYGIYCWHFVAIALVLALSRTLPGELHPVLFQFLFVGLSMVVTVLISALSYRYLEMPCNRLRFRLESIDTSRSQA